MAGVYIMKYKQTILSVGIFEFEQEEKKVY